MTSASQTGVALAFGYDALGRQTSETGPLATVTQQYDVAGRRTQLGTSSGYVLNYQRLKTGELSRDYGDYGDSLLNALIAALECSSGAAPFISSPDARSPPRRNRQAPTH